MSRCRRHTMRPSSNLQLAARHRGRSPGASRTSQQGRPSILAFLALLLLPSRVGPPGPCTPPAPRGLPPMSWSQPCCPRRRPWQQQQQQPPQGRAEHQEGAPHPPRLSSSCRRGLRRSSGRPLTRWRPRCPPLAAWPRPSGKHTPQQLKPSPLAQMVVGWWAATPKGNGCYTAMVARPPRELCACHMGGSPLDHPAPCPPIASGLIPPAALRPLFISPSAGRRSLATTTHLLSCHTLLTPSPHPLQAAAAPPLRLAALQRLPHHTLPRWGGHGAVWGAEGPLPPLLHTGQGRAHCGRGAACAALPSAHAGGFPAALPRAAPPGPQSAAAPAHLHRCASCSSGWRSSCCGLLLCFLCNLYCLSGMLCLALSVSVCICLTCPATSPLLWRSLEPMLSSTRPPPHPPTSPPGHGCSPGPRRAAPPWHALCAGCGICRIQPTREGTGHAAAAATASAGMVKVVGRPACAGQLASSSGSRWSVCSGSLARTPLCVCVGFVACR